MPRQGRATPEDAAGVEAQRNVGGKGVRFFPCPVCGNARDVRASKNGKPYIVCQSCGVQMFVRYAAGIARFESQCVPESAAEVRAPLKAARAERLVSELADLRERRAKLTGLFASDDAKQAAAVFAREIAALEAELSKLAKPKRKKSRRKKRKAKRARK